MNCAVRREKKAMLNAVCIVVCWFAGVEEGCSAVVIMAGSLNKD